MPLVMIRALSAVGILLLLSACLEERPRMIARARIEGGVVQGEPSGNPDIARFLGIPFAAPPVDGLRWKIAGPVISWRGIHDARRFSPKCMQSFAPAGSISEDCLYLNVWTPARSESEKLPVIVLIHGGNFQFGSGEESEDMGDALAAQGAVIVTFNYRLGVFGFLTHPSLDQESEIKVSGNYGILDQIAALQWIRREIGHFGGDSANVTVIGHSAGGNSVADLMVSPLAAGLFHKAIFMSGYAADAARSYESPGEDIARRLGCSDQNTLRCLRAIPAMELLRRTSVDQLGMHRLTPVVDGVVIPEPPARVFERGAQRRMPVIVGFSKNEASLDPSLKSLEGPGYRKFLNRCFPKDADRVARVASRPEELGTAIHYLRHARELAAALSRAKSDVFFYEFGRVPIFARRDRIGAFHGLDLSYLLKSRFSKENYNAIDPVIALELQKRWVAFARTGVPDLPTHTLHWPKYDAETESYLEVADTALVSSHPEATKMRLLDRVEYGECGYWNEQKIWASFRRDGAQ